MNAAMLMRALWFAGGLAILLGWGRDTILGWQPRPRELPRADNQTGRPWITGDFLRDERVAPGPLPGHIQHASSFVSGTPSPAVRNRVVQDLATHHPGRGGRLSEQDRMRAVGGVP